MPQTFYIENDEEIISVIGRLRKSSLVENYFVFPKRALVLQSIVNLRLFQREAEKLGKKIIIVTQDDAGKALAEKAGLVTERYTDDFSRQTEHIEMSGVEAPVKKQVAPMSVEHSGLRSKDIGSSDFYAGGTLSSTEIAPATASTPEMRPLRIRNASPDKQTSLNSQRYAESIPLEKSAAAPAMAFHPQVSMPESVAPVAEKNVLQSIQREIPRQSVQAGREERLRNFFSTGNAAAPRERESAPVVTPQRTAPTATPPVAAVPVVPHKIGKIFFLFAAISIVSLLGVAVFLFLPRAEVHVVPYRSVESADLQFEGRADAATDDEQAIAVRLVEKEHVVEFSVDATGVSPGSAQKARGTVVLSNTFSSDPQSLVATTRLESPDGKIFRLLEGITIPGMSGTQPGSIEASVIADQTGTEYNIAATTFTIPGFKSGPKYEKFSARSTKAMAGGSASSGGSQTIISKTDLEKAATMAQEQAKKAYIDGIASELLPGEKVLEENMDIFSLEDATLPLSGTAAQSFQYKNTFKVRSFVFSEEILKQRILSRGQTVLGGTIFRPVSVQLTYGEAVPDFEGKTVRLKTHAIVTSESVIDRDKFLKAIMGTDEEGINATLGAFPEIKKLEIVFKPQWFTSSVPNAEGRVTLLVEPGQE